MKTLPLLAALVLLSLVIPHPAFGADGTKPLGCPGSPDGKTPNTDAIAASGVRG